MKLDNIAPAADSFQARVAPWMQECFGPEISADRLERGDRFLEEDLELLQSGGYPEERIYALTRYVYRRPAGELRQEVGGVQVTLAAYCLAHGIDMHEAGEIELARISMVAKIRAKQAAKPTGSALPTASTPAWALSDSPVDWTPAFEAEREELCRYWVDLADTLEGSQLAATLVRKARDTEEALTILGDIANHPASRAGAARSEIEFVPTQPLTFTYRNWKGEVSVRRVKPQRIRFGSTEWHPEPQYLLRAFDLDKQAMRDFAFADILPAPAGARPPADSQGAHFENMRKHFSEKGQHVSSDPEHIGYAAVPGATVAIKWRAHNHHVWRADVGDYRLEIVHSLGDGTWAWKVDDTGRCSLASYDEARAGAEADVRRRIERDQQIGHRARAAAAALSAGAGPTIPSEEDIARAICRGRGVNPDCQHDGMCSDGHVDGERTWIDPFTKERRYMSWHYGWSNYRAAAREVLALILPPPAGEAGLIDALLAGKPFVFDPATHYVHADDGGAPEHGIRYVPAPPAEPVAGWIVGNGARNRWRCWRDGWSDWTDDRAKATRYARREDAEEVHREDEGAWTIEPYKVGAPR